MKTILLIDDDPDILEMVRLRLEANTYEVYSASDGAVGMVKAKNANPDLIILDVMMPHMDGHAFIQEMKREPHIKNTPVLIFTAKEHMEDLFKIEGINNYMTKPFEPDVFIAKVKELVGE